MGKTKILLISFIVCLIASLIFPMAVNKVYAELKNEVILNFKDGIIHDGYVEYSKLGALQLFKDDELVVNISNNMTIDLNEANYEFRIRENIVKDPDSIFTPIGLKIKINEKYYPILNSTFKLDSSKFNGTLNIKLEAVGIVINTNVENVYTDITSTGTIDLTNQKEYVIDFSKNDELTNGLKTFADLEKTVYYKRVNESLLITENENEAVIKIVGNKEENKAILTAVNVGTKKNDNFKGFHTRYTGSRLEYNGSTGGVTDETRFDYYTRCSYDFTLQYVKEEVKLKEYKFIEGANQTHVIDESENATFRIDADYSLFTHKVYVDNNLLDNTNYDSKSGSTIIILKEAFLKSLSVGEHTLKVAFSDNGEAITKFTIKEKQQNTNIEENKNAENEQKQENTNAGNNEKKAENVNNNLNPKTGDKVITYVILFTISIVGIVALIIINTKKNKNSEKC